MIFGLSLLLVYLVLSAQYESFILPLIILLGVPLAVFGALLAQLFRGFSNDVFCQVGRSVVGLAAKNSILIVEFAEQLRERGLSIVDAAIESARIRLRPILMTSFAFILGVMPLAFATGAGAASRNSVGTAVAGGMLTSTFLSIVFIPVLYVVIRSMFPGAPTAIGEATRRLTSTFGGGLFRTRRRTSGGRSYSRARRGDVRVCADGSRRDRHIQRSHSARSGEEPFTRDCGDEHPALRSIAAAGPLADHAARRGDRDQHHARYRPRVQRPDGKPQNQTVFGLNAALPIAPAQWAAKTQAMDQVEIARLSVTDARRQIAVATASAYLAVIAQKRQVDVIMTAIETARGQLDYNTKRREGGVGSRLNELRSSQVLSSAEAQLELLRLSVCVRRKRSACCLPQMVRST